MRELVDTREMGGGERGKGEGGRKGRRRRRREGWGQEHKGRTGVEMIIFIGGIFVC